MRFNCSKKVNNFTMKNKLKIAIIGGGVSGLTAGIYALKNGYDVTIYEKTATVGGNLTAWHRNGYEIDNCIHWLTGTNKNSKTYKTWCEIGAFRGEKIYQQQNFFTARLNGEEIGLNLDLNKTQSDMLKISPADKREILAFINAVKCVNKISDLDGENFNQKTSASTKILCALKLARYVKMSASDMQKLFKHPLLKMVFGGYIQGNFSALGLIVSYSTFVTKNGGIIDGGSLKMANNLRQSFLSLGGEILTHCNITSAEILNESINKITVFNKPDAYADFYIFCCDVFSTYKILDLPLPKVFCKIKNQTFSSFQTALLVDNSDLPFSDETLLKVKDGYSKFVGNTLTVRNFPYIKNANKDGKILIETMFICSNACSLKWIELKKKNKQKYQKNKVSLAKLCIKILEEEYPVLKGKISLLDAWTPATYHRYFGQESGAYMSNILTKLRFQTNASQKIKGVKNGLIASQWLKSPGGLPIACEQGYTAILNLNKLCKKLGNQKQFKISTQSVVE